MTDGATVSVATRNPLAVRGAVVAAVIAVVDVLASLGVFDLTLEQQSTLATAVGLVGTAVVVVWSRGAVTPVADPRDDDGNQLVPAVDAP